MTIDEVMSRIQAWRQAQPGDICHGWNELRAAILALLDEEAEACAQVCGEYDACDPKHIAVAIRARIDARKGGAKP
jgi:hypothetical protein